MLLIKNKKEPFSNQFTENFIIVFKIILKYQN